MILLRWVFEIEHVNLLNKVIDSSGRSDAVVSDPL